MQGHPTMRSRGAALTVEREKAFLGDESTTPLLLSNSHSPGIVFSVIRGIITVAVITGTVAALILGIVAVVVAVRGGNNFVSLDTSSPAEDLLVVGSTDQYSQRHEAGCSVSTRISEVPITDPNSGEGLRNIFFDLEACNEGGNTSFSVGLGFDCAEQVLPPPPGAFPAPGLGCPAGQALLGTLYNTGGIVVPSDERIKENISPLSTGAALASVVALNVRQYHHTEQYAASSDMPFRFHKAGFISQEVEAVIPHAVRTVGRYTLPDGSVLEDFKMLNKEELIAYTVGAIQELATRNSELRDLVVSLNARVAALE